MLNAPQSSRLENSLQKMSSKDPLKQRNRFVDKKKKKTTKSFEAYQINKKRVCKVKQRNRLKG